MIQSVDSMKLAQEISKQSVKHGVTTRVLVEVNIGREESKSGIMIEHCRSCWKKRPSCPVCRSRV